MNSILHETAPLRVWEMNENKRMTKPGTLESIGIFTRLIQKKKKKKENKWYKLTLMIFKIFKLSTSQKPRTRPIPQSLAPLRNAHIGMITYLTIEIVVH